MLAGKIKLKQSRVIALPPTPRSWKRFMILPPKLIKGKNVILGMLISNILSMSRRS